MILLDTNVLSAVMRSKPDRAVVDWLDSLPADSIWLTAITVFEARFGLALLPGGKRRHDLEARFEALLSVDLNNRVLPFDPPAAAMAAELAARRQRAGKPVDVRDTFIAGIALAHNADIATRNTRHFADLTVAVIDPWRFGADA
ncbi:MAG: type II toxin-antitoxin system VapC family toxin [Sulfuritalea sp.]|nr:type II toxin-antitoxin system VapC family toxin [Sulfuritalea sp.]MDP1983199.1 type II toxin-antitoxin system VapC family toxin [Sulfuritalea sp.]